MIMNYNTRIYFLFVIVFLPTLVYSAFGDTSFFDDLYLPDDISTFMHQPVRSNPADPAECLVELDAIRLLQQSLFCHTNPLRVRSLLDYPDFLPITLSPCGKEWTFGAQVFFNATPRCVFDKNSTGIASYLAIQSPTLLEQLNKCASIVTSFLPFAPNALLSLFKNTTINERRTGFMFHMQREWCDFRFRIMTPFYYLERNFFLTECERAAIEQVLGRASEEETELFAKRHLISDKLGVGDTRLTFDKRVFTSENFDLTLGVLATLPTAFMVGRSFLGSNFTKVEQRPVLDIEKLFMQLQGSKAEKAAAQESAKKFALGILDNLSANLLTTGLGNNKHLGVGAYYETNTRLQKFIKLPWACNFKIRSRVSLEYLLPKTENRWFVECSNKALFDALDLNDRTTAEIVEQIKTDPAYAQAVLNLLEAQLVDRLYPFAFNAQVNPGIILRSTGKLLYEVEKWGFFIGSDFWFTSSETIKKVQVCAAGDNRPPNINIKKAELGRAYESKVVGGAFWKIDRCNHQWLLSLNGDCSTWGSGIGRNFTISFDMEVKF